MSLRASLTVVLTTPQGEIFAAEGYAKITGEVGVCIATSGPGATNLVTGLADALLDSIPMVAITGQVRPSLWNPPPPPPSPPSSTPQPPPPPPLISCNPARSAHCVFNLEVGLFSAVDCTIIDIQFLYI